MRSLKKWCFAFFLCINFDSCFTWVLKAVFVFCMGITFRRKDLLVELCLKKEGDSVKINRRYSLTCDFVFLGAAALAGVSPIRPASYPHLFLVPKRVLAHLAGMFEQYVPRIFLVWQGVVHAGGFAFWLCIACGVAFTRCFVFRKLFDIRGCVRLL